MFYKWQYSFTWLFFVAGLVLAAMQAQANGLALTEAQRSMVAIGQAVCVGVLPFLPKLQAPPDDSRAGKD